MANLFQNPFLCTEDTLKGSEDILILGKWYWVDETTKESNLHPFDTEEEARRSMEAYAPFSKPISELRQRLLENEKTLRSVQATVEELTSFRDKIVQLVREKKLSAVLPEIVRVGYGENQADRAFFLKPVPEKETSNPKFAVVGPDYGKDGGKL